MSRLNSIFKLNGTWRRRCVGALVVAALGLSLLWTRLGEGLDHFSYDSIFLFTSRRAPADIVLVKMDELAHRELKQDRGAWDRGLHARLLDKLRQDQAKLVVFDVFLTEQGHPATNALLADAIGANGRVVLAGDLQPINDPGFVGQQPLPPLELFRKACAGWGFVNLSRDLDLTVRYHFPGTDLDPSLAWAAAAAMKAPVTRTADRMAFFQTARWLRYYDGNQTLTNSYHLALDKEPGYFRDKIVFIGGEPRTRFSGEEADEFRTPFTRWTGQLVAGVDIHATAFLNLLHNDWLTRLPRSAESLVLIVAGIFFAVGLGLVPLRFVVPIAVVGMVAISVASLWVTLHGGYWFGWTTIAGAQIPAACAWVLMGRRPVAVSEDASVKISGHTLLRSIGRGAYGEVWLARDVIGRFHAVKVIHRRTFPSHEPFEREFRGIQKFTPISRSHPGFVHVLHVDRDEAAGYFYYVMEAGDDEMSGQTINPDTYIAKNLSRELTRRGRLPIDECLALSVALASALDHLHRHQLIHRDIKPSNIIFVNNAPKLADIGLVTDIGRDGKAVTHIGTEGYLAPEGPGTPAADVYSLGKVIYETAMGCSRERFPELPSTLLEKPAAMKPLLELNEIIVRACAPDVLERYQTAADLLADLLFLQEHLVTTQA